MMLKKIELSESDFKVKGADSTNYLTHNFHSYPAKFIPQIPRKTIDLFTSPGDLILDPFCGCGTTLVEAKISGRHSVGIDLKKLKGIHRLDLRHKKRLKLRRVKL